MSKSFMLSVASCGEYSALQRALQAHPQSYTKESLGRVMCNEQVRSRIDIVELLLQHGADVETAYTINYFSRNCTALYFACEKVSISMVKLLLKYGAKINHHLNTSCCPLLIAYNNRRISCVVLLLEHGGNMLTILQHVCTTNDSQILKLLINRRFDIHKQFPDDITPLHLACKANSANVIEVLLSHGADVHAVDSKGQTPLHCAVKSLECVKLLVAHGTDFRQPRGDGKTPLAIAYESEYISSFHWLVSQGNITETLQSNKKTIQEEVVAIAMSADIKITSHVEGESGGLLRLFIYGGESIVKKFLQQVDLSKVSCADQVHEGRYEWLKLVLELGMNPNIVDSILSSYTPLHYAASQGDVRRAELLIKHGANVNSQLPVSCVTPLMLAVDQQTLSVVELLLTHGADVNSMTKVADEVIDENDNENEDNVENVTTYGNGDGSTALSKAIYLKDLECVQLLLQHGADPNHIIMGRSLLHHLASEQNGYSCMKLLLEQGADPNNTNDTVLHEVVGKEYGQRMIELLLEYGANINAADEFGNTPLHNALYRMTNRLGIMELLVNNGANVNALTKNGDTPLVHTVRKLDFVCVQYLIQHGANVHHVSTSSGYSLLHEACKSHYYSGKEKVRCAELLITHQLNVNAVDNGGYSALHLLALIEYGNYIAVAELLIRVGLDVNLLNGKGQSALHIACIRINVELAKLLLENGGGQHINEETKDGYATPLSCALACKYYSRTSLVKLLLLHGAKLQSVQVNDIMKTKVVNGDELLSAVGHLSIEDMITIACANNNCDFVEAYFHCSNSTKIDFRPAVMAAVIKGHVDCLEVMIHHGVNVNAAGSCSRCY